MKSGNPVHVLIIDSDTVRRGLLACTLPASRYSLEFAASLERGLDMLGNHRPAVIVVGAEGNATDSCQRIRSLPAGSACLLILMDELFHDAVVGRTAADAAGADAFLPFPFESESFDACVESWLAADRPSQLSPAAEARPPLHVAAPAPRDVVSTDSSAKVNPEQAWRRFRTRVEQIYGQLDSMDYYRLLEVPLTASTAAIKDAYFRCSMEFHPDRFLRLPDQQLRTAIYEIFKRMSEAFKVLISPEARTRYDANLASPEREASLRYLDRDRSAPAEQDPTADAKTPAGKKYLHYAILAESEGKLRSVRMYLSMALQYEPDNEALQARRDRVAQRLR